MKTLKNSLLVITAAVALTLLVSAQQPNTGNDEQMQGMQNGQMMQNCQKHCSATAKEIDQLSRQIDEARQSNDPAKMRAALDAAQTQLNDLKQGMNMCMNMKVKSMRQRMRGMCGMGGSNMP